MQTTENYRLFKPEAGDNGSPAPFNSNSEIIDAELYRLATGLDRVDDALVAAQNVLNSGITSAKVAKLDALPTGAQLEGSLSNKANKSDITNISITGSTNDIGRAISAETLFYLNGSLCKTLLDVANGATFTEDTNYTRYYINNFIRHIISVQKNDFTLPTNYTSVISYAIPPHCCYAINGFVYASTGRATGIYIDYTGNTGSQSGALAIREDANGVYGVSCCGYNSKNYPVSLYLVAKGDSNTTVNAEFNGWYEYVS